MGKINTNIKTPKRDSGKDADIIEDLEIMAGSIQEELNKKVDDEKGKGLSTNDFTDILKEKLENLENYNDTEIRNLLNGSLKGVNYTASNGMLTFTANDGSQIQIDLPLELLIQSGRYDEANSQIVLVLANGNSINIPVSSLLDDFYGKGETYNKTEIDNLISQKQKQIETLEDEIGELKEENQAQQEEIDILKSEYTEKELEGETVIISNGLPKSKVKANIKGNTYQDTREGYNKIKITAETQTKNGLTLTIFEDKSFTVTGTPTANTATTFYLNEGAYVDFTPYFDKQMTIDCGYVTPANNQGAISCRAFDNDGNMLKDNFWNIDASANAEYRTKTISSESYDISNGFNLRYSLFFSGVAEPTEVNIKGYLQLNEGERKPYEPYGSKPSIEFPSEIVQVEAYNKLKSDELIGKKVSEVATTNQATSLKFTEHSIKAGKEYTFKLALDNVDFTTSQFLLAFRNSSNTSIKTVLPNKTLTFTEDEISLISYMFLYYNGADNLGDKIITKLMLVESKCADKPQMKYGHIGYIHRGKNIHRLTDNIYKESYNVSSSITGDSFTMVGLGLWGNAGVMFENPKENTDISISADFLETAIVSKKGLQIYGNNTLSSTGAVSLKSITSEIALNNKKTLSVTANTETYKYIFVRFWNNASAENLSKNTNCVVDNFQFEFGEPTPYEPYHEPKTIPINLNGNKLAKATNEDLLKIFSNGNVQIEDKVGSKILNGSETGWFKSNTSLINAYGIANTRTGLPVLNKNSICNRFRYTDKVGPEHASRFTSVNDNFYLMFDLNMNATRDEFLAWLSENPIELIYDLPEEDYGTIDLPSIEPIELFEGTNVFELVTNLDTTMSVTYKVSNKSRLENLENVILSLGGNI